MLENFSVSSGPAVTASVWEGTWLRAKLERSLQPGEILILEASLTLRLPVRTADAALRPMVFGWSERQTNLVDWFLYLPPYQTGQGWLAHLPGYYGEHQVYEAADFKVNLQVTGAPQGLVAAASAPEKRRRLAQLRTQRRATFAISLSPEYQTAVQMVGDVSVTSYFWAYHASPDRPRWRPRPRQSNCIPVSSALTLSLTGGN